MAWALTNTIATPIFGMLADRFGRRPVLLFSLAAYALSFGGYLLASSAQQLIVMRGVAGALTAGMIPATTSIVGDLAPQSQRGKWIGIVTGGSSAGWIAGPLLGGLLYDRFGHAVPFTASLAMAAGALLLALPWVPETHATARDLDRPGLAWARGLRRLSAPPAFLLVLLVTFGVMFAWAYSEPQLMFYAYDDLSWTSTQLGLVMSAFGVAFTFGEVVLGHLSDRVGRKPVVVTGLALFSAQFLGPVVFRDVPRLAVSFFLAGLGNALFDPALSALILDISPPERSAGMLGLNGMAGALGRLLGPSLVVVFLLNPRTVFLIAAALVAALTLAAALAPNSREAPRDPQGLNGRG